MCWFLNFDRSLLSVSPGTLLSAMIVQALKLSVTNGPKIKARITLHS